MECIGANKERIVPSVELIFNPEGGIPWSSGRQTSSLCPQRRVFREFRIRIAQREIHLEPRGEKNIRFELEALGRCLPEIIRITHQGLAALQIRKCRHVVPLDMKYSGIQDRAPAELELRANFVIIDRV